MAVSVPSPPRMTGDPTIDLPSIAQWASDFYKAIEIEGAYLKTSEQLDSGDFDPASLPDPASTNLATAQQTANNAYILANLAKTRADASPRLVKAGTLTISDANTTGDFTFDAAEADTGYFTLVSPADYSGTPSLAATNVIRHTKAADKVTVTINTAPGVGNSVTFNVFVFRTS